MTPNTKGHKLYMWTSLTVGPENIHKVPSSPNPWRSKQHPSLPLLEIFYYSHVLLFHIVFPLTLNNLSLLTWGDVLLRFVIGCITYSINILWTNSFTVKAGNQLAHKVSSIGIGVSKVHPKFRRSSGKQMVMLHNKFNKYRLRHII